MEWEPILRELADDSSEFEQDGGTVAFTRQGSEHTIDVRVIPNGGPSVVLTENGTKEYVPIGTYIQRDLLGLPRLARQVLRALERSAKVRPQFVEGPATAILGRKETNWPAVSVALTAELEESEPGTTRLIQLMAPAGQGKTVLLEEIALAFAKKYQPAPHPSPILLPVDLLGRYVGTIDDAIAGSLNNTYVFPGLSQRDVALCVRKRWLVLALDGFDELVARVGARDAFLRITELLDQLHGEGTIIISARESFFELYQITSAIRSYLQPRTGSYSTITARLLPWTRVQGLQVFNNLGSEDSETDLDDLTIAFEGDEQIVLHPFFLTRLASLWKKGERFIEAGQQNDRLTRTKYVIETFIARESSEKWVTRDGKPLLTAAEHTVMLGVIAEEMWRSGAFRLTIDEAKVATEIGLAEAKVASALVDEITNRIPTHAALASRERGITFVHDRFFHYFLGCHLANLVARQDRSAVEQTLMPREFSPHVVEWVRWKWSQLNVDTGKAIAFLNEFGAHAAEAMVGSNAALLIAALLRDHTGAASVKRKIFVGNALIRGKYSNTRFAECQFWHVDLSGATFQNCAFEACEFGDLRVSVDTRLDGSTLDNCQFTSLDIGGELTVFVPAEIEKRLSDMGAKTVKAPEPGPVVQKARVRAGAIKCVERYLRASERTCDVAIESIEEDCDEATVVARAGLDAGVFRTVSKQAHGPKKTFVRFTIDREKLLPGQLGPTGDAAIDGFWDILAKKFPAK